MELQRSRLDIPPTPKRFYRPELDALRFFAFFSVFVHHGPGIYPQAHAPLFALTMRWPPFSYSALWSAAVYAITLAVTTGIAILSYEYFEKFFLRLKSRLEFIKSR